MFWLLFLSLSLLGRDSGTKPVIALLPCERLPKASKKDTERLDTSLRDELKDQAIVVAIEKIEQAMADKGIKGSSSCDDACLLALGRVLQADRVVSQTLTYKLKEQVPGGVWFWIVHQIDVKSGKTYGHFERAWVHSSKTWWDNIARIQAAKLIAFDPSTRLKLKNLKKAEPTKGPIDIPQMVYVPEGEFIMGSEIGELDEEPRHIVYLDAYYIDKYEVTNEDYNKCVEAGKCFRQGVQAKDLIAPKNPAVAVGFDNAVAYCRFVDKRLPTEAEWEKAARGTDERLYPWGNEWHADWVNMHNDKDGFASTAPVGSFPSNVSPYGAYDMAGNAWEWTADWAGEDYYQNSPQKNPKGPETGERRVMRGGSWSYDIPFFVSSTNRSPGRPWIRKKYVGFRCAKDVP